ncbi:BrnA antitoxin family protein [Viridibacterium curvum]|uniref:BrnA antitoxin of type II toxin-antitoxin system n=1 Tax=Viridibacterium curvum TaxID=1101404 RepID=A0ABP9R011_9RHOO
MKQTSTTAMSATSDDAPKLTQADFDKARFRQGQQEISREQWQSEVRAKVAKQRISIMLDAPIIEHFKALAGERGYQTLINEALRRAVTGDQFVATMRQAIRDELRAARSADSA